jgi:hypothetical protein
MKQRAWPNAETFDSPPCINFSPAAALSQGPRQISTCCRLGTCGLHRQCNVHSHVLPHVGQTAAPDGRCKWRLEESLTAPFHALPCSLGGGQDCHKHLVPRQSDVCPEQRTSLLPNLHPSTIAHAPPLASAAKFEDPQRPRRCANMAAAPKASAASHFHRAATAAGNGVRCRPSSEMIRGQRRTLNLHASCKPRAARGAHVVVKVFAVICFHIKQDLPL